MSDPNFALHVTEESHGPVVVISGELDIATAPQLGSCLEDLAGKNVTVDFSGVTFMDSTGINVLVTADKRVKTLGGEIVLHGVQPAQMRVFEIVGLVGHLNFDGDQPTT